MNLSKSPSIARKAPDFNKRAKVNTLLERYLERLPVDYIMHENILRGPLHEDPT